MELKTCDVNLHMHLLEIEITTKCNLNCPYCYNRGYADREMPLDNIYALIKFAENYNVSTIVISGGEASLHSQFNQLCQYILENRPKVKRIVVQSNGYIENINVNLLKAFDSIHLSYELESKNIRNCKPNRIIQFGKKLKHYGIHSYLFSTIHAQNIEDIDEIVKNAQSAELDVGFNICCETNSNQYLLLSPLQKKNVFEKLVSLYKEKKILRFGSPMVSIIEGWKSDKFIGSRGGCTAGIAACCILTNGDIIPCPFLRIIVGNIYKDDLKNIWLNSQILKTLRSREKFKGICNGCEYLSFCGGCRKTAYERTNDLLGEDSSCFRFI